MWVPVKHAETKATKNLDDIDVDHGLKIAEHQSDEGVVNCTKTSSVSKEALSTEEKGNGVKLRQAGQSDQFEKQTNSGHDPHARPDAISSRTIQKPKSANTQADLIIKNYCIGTSKSLSPRSFKSNTSTSTRWDSGNVSGQGFNACTVYDQQRIFLAGDKMFASKR